MESQEKVGDADSQETGGKGSCEEEEERLSDFGSPKRGPTLSTSTSSFEALDPHDPNLSHLATLMFSQTSNYLQVCFKMLPVSCITHILYCIFIDTRTNMLIDIAIFSIGE